MLLSQSLIFGTNYLCPILILHLYFQGFISDTEAADEQLLLADRYIEMRYLSQIYSNENHSSRTATAPPLGAGVEATLPRQSDNKCKKTKRKSAQRVAGGCTTV